MSKSLLPCIQQTVKETGLSEKYKFISSKEIVEQFERAGFELNSVTYPNRSKRSEFRAHSMRFRSPNVVPTGDLKNEYHPEIIVVNSHDGTHACKILAGVFRFVCSNGLVVGNSIVNQRIVHIGYKPAQIGTAIDFICQQLPTVQGLVKQMQETQLDDRQLDAFLQRVAIETIEQRLGKHQERVSVDLDSLDRARRSDDTGNTLWCVFNRVQENLLRYNNALTYITVDGKRHTVRKVTGVREQIGVNQMLWNSATETLKQAA